MQAREHRRLTRSVECHFPACEGWDIEISTKASSDRVQKLPWTASAVRSKLLPSILGGRSLELIVFHVGHASMPDSHLILKVRIVIKLSGPSSGIRLNGIPQIVQDIKERDSGSFVKQQQILQDASSATDVSFQASSSVSSVGTIGPESTPTRARLLSAQQSGLLQPRSPY